MPQPAYRYTVQVERWVDGDTVDVTVDLGFRVSFRTRVRLRHLGGGLDAPERFAPGGPEATARACALAPAGTLCTLHSHELDRYGRAVGSIVLDSGLDVGAQLLAEGHAAVWLA